MARALRAPEATCARRVASYQGLAPAAPARKKNAAARRAPSYLWLARSALARRMKKSFLVKRKTLTGFKGAFFQFPHRRHRSAPRCFSCQWHIVLHNLISFVIANEISQRIANHAAENTAVIFQKAVNVFREVVLWICSE
jgi:hypothetical protein